MTQLEPCPACRRHVKVSETACPFCAHSLADAFADRPPRPAPTVRLGRAAAFAFGMVAMSQAACGDNGTGTPTQDAVTAPKDAGSDGGIHDADGSGVPIYAAAPTPDAGKPSRG